MGILFVFKVKIKFIQRITTEGNALPYKSNLSASIANIIILKKFISSVVNTLSTKFIIVNFKNYYLAAISLGKQCILIQVGLVLEEILEANNILLKCITMLYL